MSLVQAQDFPAADKCTYLNSASVALMYKGAEEAAVAWQRDIAEYGTLNFDEVAEDRVFDELRDAFATLIGAQADDIAVASSATELIASLAWALAPPKGKNIVGVDVVFPSTMYPWTRVARHTGCDVRWVKARDIQVREEDIIAAIDDDTAAVVLSHVEYGSGQRYDLAKIGAAAHAHGALLIVDTTQAIGGVPVDIEKEPVDALIAGSYKWMCGPFGVGLLYLTPHLQATLDPGLVGWRSHKVIYQLQADRIEYLNTARRFEFSTMAYGCAIGLTRSIRFLADVGVERIYRHNMQLTDKLIAALESAGGRIASPTAGPWRTSIVSVRFAAADSQSVVRHLTSKNIVVSPRRDFVRISIHLYNGENDLDRLMGALTPFLKQPHRAS